MVHELPAYITISEAAQLLGVTRERVMYWIREGLLKPIGQTEAGALLLRRRTVVEDGEPLASLWPYRTKPKSCAHELRSVQQKLLPCGCCPARVPFALCRTGVSLLAAVQLAEGFAVEYQFEPLYQRLAEITREAFAKHLAGDDVSAATIPAGTNIEAAKAVIENGFSLEQKSAPGAMPGQQLRRNLGAAVDAIPQ